MVNLEKQFEKFVLCWLATVSKEGVPNVSPKELFICPSANEIWIANIASPQSVRNIRENPRVCVSGIDIWTQKGWQAKGTATLVLPSATMAFENLSSRFEDKNQARFKIKQIIKISVEQTKQILAPSYLFYPATTEKEQIQKAKEQYAF